MRMAASGGMFHHDAEADAFVGGAPGAVRGTKVIALVFPTSAAQQTINSLVGTAWVGRGTGAVVTLVEPVAAPLPDIAVHVIQPERIGGIVPHDRGAL